MKKISTAVSNFINDEDGLTTVEYAIAGALVAAGVIGSFTTLGTNVKARIDVLAAALA